MLPTAPVQAANPLIERVPSWAAGVAYSLYLATGGRLGEQLFDEILGETIERRARRTMEAPAPFGEFLAYQFERGADDRAWLNFLQREALAVGEGPIQHEAERVPVMLRQVDEVRHRQADHLVAEDLDPALVRLMVFALSSYPRLLPQITHMSTELAPSDPVFESRWAAFLGDLGDHSGRSTPSVRPSLLALRAQLNQGALVADILSR
jgi:hypothetical protein